MKKSTVLLIVMIYFYSTGMAQWKPIDSGTEDELEAIHFIDGNIGYCSGFLADKLKTTDGGDSWSTIDSSGLTDFGFFDETVGFSTGSTLKRIGSTTDGGDSWTFKLAPYANFLFAVSATSSTTAYFCGTGGVVYKTIDGGNSVTILDPGTTQHLTDIIFTNFTTGYLVVQNGQIRKTVDSGVTWSAIYTDSTAIFTEMFFVNENIGFVVGHEGNIIKTEDAGVSWTSLVSNSTNNLQGVNFFDDQNGIVVGDNGEIGHTTNGGISWNIQSTGTAERLMDVAMLSPLEVIVVGDKGTILKNNFLPSSEETALDKVNLIFPNPVSNELMIHAAEKINSIQIFNASGRLVLADKSILSEKYVIDFSTYNHGMYFVLINSKAGTSIKKIIKE